MDPILDPEQHELEDALMKAGRDVGMSPELRAKTLAAIAGGAAGGAVALGGTKAGAFSWLSSKVATLAAVGAIAIGGGALVMTNADPESSEQPAESPGVVQPQTSKMEEAAPPVESPPAREAPPAEATEIEVAETPRPVTKAKPSASKQPSLKDEVAHLGKVEAALGSGNPSGALNLLAEYRAKFARRRLGLEAEILTIQALHESGSKTAANQRAAKFIQAHPGSPLSARAKRYIE